MKLSEFLSKLPRGGRTEFARSVGISPVYLYQLEQGIRRPNAELAVAISKASGGKVPCEALRPDIDWAYLRSSKRKAA